MGKGDLTKCGILTRRKPAAIRRRVQSPSLPGLGVQGAFGIKGPRSAYDDRLMGFVRTLERLEKSHRTMRRRDFHDYTTKNCEEASGEQRFAPAVHVAHVVPG